MSNDPIKVEYNNDLKPLEALLSGIKRSGDFFTSGRVEIPMPKVEVEGSGMLSFPVPPAQIASLIRQATRAPYGRGEETILDESVRKVWQLPPAKVRIGGKSWEANFDSILRVVSAGLGCPGMGVCAELYKLLVYDEGGFFLAHRDTEKVVGMFGTLVVCLPSAHHGGALVIRHGGREVVVDLGGAEVSEVTFAAFYADCEHEVRPITEGNRVCLVYNLIHKPGVKGHGRTPEAPDNEKEIKAAARLLARTLTAPEAPAKLAWLLEHQYSPDGLGFAALKPADAARVKVLTSAAEQAECVAHLGIVHIEESGAAEPEFGSYRPRRRGWWRDEDQEDEVDDASAGFEIIEVFDSRRYVDQWRDARDQPVEFGQIPLGPGELLPAGAMDDEKPDKQRLMEASGNEGASFERSYHRAALVIWRRDRYAEVLLQAGVESALPCLEERVAAAGAKGAPRAARGEALSLARRIVDEWNRAPVYFAPGDPGERGGRKGMLRLLNKLGDAPLLAAFIDGAVVRDYDGSENAALAAGSKVLGAEEAGRVFSGLFDRNMERLPGHCITLLAKLGGAIRPEFRSALVQAAGFVVAKLNKVRRKQPDQGRTIWESDQSKSLLDPPVVAALFNTLGDWEASALRTAAAESLVSRPEAYDPVSLLTPALGLIRVRDSATAILWEGGVKFLLRRSGSPPPAPLDWRQEASLGCSCADCRELQAFALDPVETVRRFAIRKDRRQHLHAQIDRHGLDMTHQTERIGSPQTLVCKKHRRSYLRRCEEYRKDMAALKELDEQSREGPVATADIVKRIKAARSRAAKWSPE